MPVTRLSLYKPAKEAWDYVMPSSPNAETHEADVAVLGVNLSETERGELVYWMEQETSVLPVLVLVNTATLHPPLTGTTRQTLQRTLRSTLWWHC